MKKICTFILALATYTGLYAQNPAVYGAAVSPSPGLVNGQGTFTFNWQNTSTIAINYDAANPSSVTFTCNKVKPVLNSGVPVVSGTLASYFNWSYDQASNSVIGLANKVIPGAQGPATPFAGSITIDIVFTEAATTADRDAQNGNGGIVNIQPGNGGNTTTTDDKIAAYTYTDGALPVAFGFTSASFAGGKLKVEWETFSEKDNKSFIVEGSKDGEKFVELDQVATQAPDGNSNEQLKYTYMKSWQEIAAKFGFSPLQLAIMVLLVISVAVSAKRAKKGAMLFSLALLITVGIGCRKDKKDLDKPEEYPTTFVRVGQVNKDGTITNYSKVVKVVAE
ncbi:hypothetical protein LL912_11230 [Niabella sp. CC-SYL272]|uniref:hypothetical protein n=1 Tax=Niabella agricola TaxID=2891571 RepID=UPI001F22F7DC|nr:hypothetical protein [Niabella agricola]MCF3109349.1 hypothetical protein [Niabella agricola]